MEEDVEPSTSTKSLSSQLPLNEPSTSSKSLTALQSYDEYYQQISDSGKGAMLSTRIQQRRDAEYVPNNGDLSSSDISDTEGELEKIQLLYNSSRAQADNLKITHAKSVVDVYKRTNNVEGIDEGTGIRRKQKIFRPKEHISKKPKRDPNTWNKNKAALNRAHGEEYVSYKNTVVLKKEPKKGILCKETCRLSCSTRFSEEDRHVLLNEFYKLDVNAKNSLLFKSIQKRQVLRERKGALKHKTASYIYSVTKNGTNERVCKDAICALYQIGRKKIDIIQSRLKSGFSAPPLDSRGRHSNRPHKIDQEVKDFVKTHINRFPVDESHYSRNRNPHKKYLSPLLNLSKMYQLYLEECNQHNLPEKFKIKKCSYSKIFVTEFNLSFGNPKSDTCAICDAGEVNEEHNENYTAGTKAIKADKEKAKTTDNLVYLTIDMQQTMPLPKLTTSKVFYLRQLWFYNFGIHIVAKNTEKASFCTWTEDMANRGSAETCSSLLRYIEVDESIAAKDHLIIWSDSCAGQNKNFHMICLYQYLILKGYFRCIDNKFPEVGHTYLDSDRDFGRIEKLLRKHDTVLIPDKYREIISTASRKNQVIDMAQHFRTISDLPQKLRVINDKSMENFVFTMDMQSVLLAPLNKVGTMYYKTKLAVHNFAIYNVNTREGYCYLWNETEGALTANEFSSVFVSFIESEVLQKNAEFGSKIILWRDGRFTK
nr:unnamed protein product [Callosobruchus chinensis]